MVYRIDSATAVASAPTPPDAGTEKFFTNGNPGGGVPATILDDWWFNMMQEEVRNVVVDAGITPDKDDNTQLLAAIDAKIAAAGGFSPFGYLAGLTLSNNGSDAANDIDIAAGVARSAQNTYDLSLAATLTKRLDAAWAVGTGNGGIFTGSKANSTCYHVFLIRKDADGTIDAGFDTSITAANKPVGYTAYRRLGSIFTDGSGNIRPFQQVGDYFCFKSAVRDVWDAAQNVALVTRTLTVPLGKFTEVDVWGYWSASNQNDGGLLIIPTFSTDTDSATFDSVYPNLSIRNNETDNTMYSGLRTRVVADASGQVKTGVVITAASDRSLRVVTHGYWDHR